MQIKNVCENDYTIYEVHILGLLGERFPDIPFAVFEVEKKNSCVLRAISMDRSYDTSVFPMFYVDGVHSIETAETMFQTIVKEMESPYEEKGLSEKDKLLCKENLYLYVLNKEKNKELLERVVHQDMLDLAVCLCFSVDGSKCDCTDAMLKELGLSYEQAYEIALKRTLADTKCESLNDIIMRMVGTPIFDDDMESYNEDMDNLMIVISNQSNVCGAGSALLNTDILFKLAERMKSDLYIIPSSIHECIAVGRRNEFGEVQRLRSMVCQVNEESVAPHEFLSNNVYLFEREHLSLSIAI